LALAATAFAIAIGHVAKAETTISVENRMKIVYRGINGSEVELKGAIGTFITDQIKYADNSGVYDVLLDAGRDARKSIEGCEIQLFAPEKSPCQIIGKGELVIDLDDGNLGSGFGVKISIYELNLVRH
jgi:hypothetical protein